MKQTKLFFVEAIIMLSTTFLAGCEKEDALNGHNSNNPPVTGGTNTNNNNGNNSPSYNSLEFKEKAPIQQELFFKNVCKPAIDRTG